jgi:hypothetical protein
MSFFLKVEAAEGNLTKAIMKRKIAKSKTIHFIHLIFFEKSFLKTIIFFVCDLQKEFCVYWLNFCSKIGLRRR